MTSRILVADDSPTIQKIVALAFENEDMEVKGVANGQDAWGMLGEFDPDIIIADVELPGITGFELTRKIKSSAEHQKRWVILLSSDFEEFDVQSFEACAAEDHLSKPFKSEDIVSKVQKMLSGEGIPNTLDIVEEDGEEASKPAPLSLSADDMEEGNAPAAINLSAGDLEEPEEEGAIGLSPDDLIDELLDGTPEKEEPPAEPVMELGEEDLATDEEPAPVEEEVEEETIEQVESTAPETDEPVSDAQPETEEEENVYSYLLTDDRMTDFDESRMPPESQPVAVTADPEPEADETMTIEPEPAEPVETMQEGNDDTSPDFILEEPRRDPDPAEDLEHAFQSVSEVTREVPVAAEPEIPESASSDATPDLIRESQAFLAEKSGTVPASEKSARPAAPTGFSEEHMTEAMVQHAARVLEAGLDRNLKKELSGISEQVNKVVRDVVQEMAPDIIREVIRQEIQEIRNSQ